MHLRCVCISVFQIAIELFKKFWVICRSIILGNYMFFARRGFCVQTGQNSPLLSLLLQMSWLSSLLLAAQHHPIVYRTIPQDDRISSRCQCFHLSWPTQMETHLQSDLTRMLSCSKVDSEFEVSSAWPTFEYCSVN